MPASPIPPGSPVVAYYRDSGGAEQERSVEQQRTAARDYCQRHGLVLVREFADEASPGGSVLGRDAFQTMIAWLRELAPEPERGKRQPDAPVAVLCWDMKRFARDDRDSAFFRADLRRRGYRLVFISDRIPPGDMAPVFEAMLSWKAQQDLADLSKDIKRGLRDRVLATGTDGRYLNLWPSRAPVGFRSEPYSLGRKRNGSPRIVQRLVPDRGGTWERVQRAFDLWAGGHTLPYVHRETRLLSTDRSYRVMFRNRLYLGILEWGGVVVEGWIEPCVSRNVWDAVQERRIEEAESRAPPRTGTGRYPLTGFLNCGLCGGPMSGSTSISRQGERSYLYRRYRCSRATMRMEGHHCNFYPRAWDVERPLFDLLTAEILTPDALYAMLAGTTLGEEERAGLEARAKQLAADVDTLDRQIGRLVDQVERYGPDPQVAQRLQKRRQERERAEVKLAKARREIRQARPEPVPDDVIRAFCDHAREILLAGSVAQVRAVLKPVLESARVWPDGRGTARLVTAIGRQRGQVREYEFRWCAPE